MSQEQNSTTNVIGTFKTILSQTVGFPLPPSFSCPANCSHLLCSHLTSEKAGITCSCVGIMHVCYPTLILPLWHRGKGLTVPYGACFVHHPQQARSVGEGGERKNQAASCQSVPWVLLIVWPIVTPSPDPGASATHVHVPISCSHFLEYPTCLRRGEPA